MKIENAITLPPVIVLEGIGPDGKPVKVTLTEKAPISPPPPDVLGHQCHCPHYLNGVIDVQPGCPMHAVTVILTETEQALPSDSAPKS